MFTCNHISSHASIFEQSFDFYVNKLGLPLLHRWPRMFAVRAGEVRISVFQSDDIASGGNVQIILRTNNIEAAKAALLENGLTLTQEILSRLRDLCGSLHWMTRTEIHSTSGNIFATHWILGNNS